MIRSVEEIFLPIAVKHRIVVCLRNPKMAVSVFSGRWSNTRRLDATGVCRQQFKLRKYVSRNDWCISTGISLSFCKCRVLNLTAAFIKHRRTSGLIERESSLLRCCVYNYQKLYLHRLSLLHIKRTMLFIHVAPGSYADSWYIQVMMACS
jgi:hypothetical protein